MEKLAKSVITMHLKRGYASKFAGVREGAIKMTTGKASGEVMRNNVKGYNSGG